MNSLAEEGSSRSIGVHFQMTVRSSNSTDMTVEHLSSVSKKSLSFRLDSATFLMFSLISACKIQSKVICIIQFLGVLFFCKTLQQRFSLLACLVSVPVL